ncbi:ParB N-terminal domain-containing protein [Burkholderia gladioli]|uniref:ParB N-terminal domain-containing protein n=1 Tax=Burkholderia gladioli TaxID=28095 RepID=UPI00163FBE83|nr:ParB N-terminal domain-containing protein [Burkholderia gladioli]
MRLTNFPIEFVSTETILPNEEHSAAHAAELAAAMKSSGLWRVPIVLEYESRAVMDGHHRLAAARFLGLARVPALRLEYRHVEVVASRDGFVVTPEEIVERARQGRLYPEKTTRHLFPSPIPNCNISLVLCQGDTRKVA